MNKKVVRKRQKGDPTPASPNAKSTNLGRGKEPPPPARLLKAIEERAAQHPELQKTQEPLFGQEFLLLISDYGYETLRSYLEMLKADPEAVRLLDSLMIMRFCMQSPKPVSAITNQIVAETVGALSKEIVAVGGVYISPNGSEIINGG